MSVIIVTLAQLACTVTVPYTIHVYNIYPLRLSNVGSDVRQQYCAKLSLSGAEKTSFCATKLHT